MIRKAQEEMIGFVLIVVLVVVIGLVFLSINLNKQPESLKSNEITSFLQASLMYSSDCYLSKERRMDLKELISACYNGEDCLDGEKSCLILNSSLNKMIERGWRIGPESPNKAYILRIYGQEGNESILKIHGGNKTRTMIMGKAEVPSDEQIEIELEIYS